MWGLKRTLYSKIANQKIFSFFVNTPSPSPSQPSSSSEVLSLWGGPCWWPCSCVGCFPVGLSFRSWLCNNFLVVIFWKNIIEDVESNFLGVLLTQTHTCKTKNRNMKCSIFYLTDLWYLSMYVTFRSTTSWDVFHRSCGPWLVCIYLHLWWSPSSLMGTETSPLDLVTWAFSCRTVHLWKPLLFRNKFSQSLRPPSACFSGTGWSWWLKELAFVSWYVGVSLELFLFLIICVVKLGYLIRASHSTECHLTPYSPKLRYQH